MRAESLLVISMSASKSALVVRLDGLELTNFFTSKVHSHPFIHSNRIFFVSLAVFCVGRKFETTKKKLEKKTVISIVNCFIILHLYIMICFTVKNFGGMFYSLSVHYDTT